LSNDIVGTRIGIYDVLYECENRANDGHKLYHVKCVHCGREFDMLKAHINRAKQCNHVGLGGIYTSTTADFVWSNKRLQRIFLHMKERCYVSKHKDYRWYGAKGIKICDEWINNPKSFEEWALANGYSDNLTIDRKEEDKDYCPENCHWISLVNNAKYKSTTSLITANNETHTGQDWARILGFGINRINEYIRIYGLDNTVKFIEAYLKNPGLKPKHKQSYYDLYMTIQN
jgi:hypothetical protein